MKTKKFKDKTADKIVAKVRDVIIKFKRMEDIINDEAAWFDGHGNLHVHRPYNIHGDAQHLCPSYFHYLGKTKKFKSHHSFPTWTIENEYDDLFAPNIALRVLASGKLRPEEMVEFAKKAVLIP